MKYVIPATFTILLALIMVMQPSCTDKLEPPIVPFCDTTPTSYDLNIQPIIEKNCSYSGCHFTGFDAGDFSSFAGLKPDLDNGSFEKHVVELKDNALEGMPPSYAPMGNPQDLEDEELELIKCWLAAGYPEN